MKRTLGVLMSIVAAVGLASSPTFASSYPPATPTVSVSVAAPAVGSPLTLVAAGFCPGATVNFAIGPTSVGSAVANAAGSATIVVTTPALLGSVPVTATSTGACPRQAVSSLTIVQPGADIPSTGTNTYSGLRIAAISVVLGLGLVGVASFRRRSRANAQ